MTFPRMLVYCWSVIDSEFVKMLERMEIYNIVYDKPMQDYYADGEWAQDIINVIIRKKIEMVFSYDYFPILSTICEVRHIPYIAWIYDCPTYTLQSESLSNFCNFIFCFDRVYTERLQKQGAKNCFHFPLAGRSYVKKIVEDTQRFEEWGKKYSCDISFVGNLYNDSRNRLMNVELSSYTKGYIEGIVQAQFSIYGYNFIKEALNSRVVDEVINKCQLSLGNMYYQENSQMVADAIGVLLTNREREKVLELVSDKYPVHVYSGSVPSESLKKKNIIWNGYVDYTEEMPYIFYNSRINLNITSRLIESGIPLRVFDILSSGGFCLTNYQPEIAEYFTDGQELVMYSDMEDMQKKIDYYLRHERERLEICRNGYEKIKKEFEEEDRIRQMLSMVYED